MLENSFKCGFSQQIYFSLNLRPVFPKLKVNITSTVVINRKYIPMELLIDLIKKALYQPRNFCLPKFLQKRKEE